MSFETQGHDISLKSSGDMSSNQYKLVVASTTNNDAGGVLVSARGGKVTGVFQDNSTATTEGAVRVFGVSKVAAGDSSGMENAINQGGLLTASSQAQAVPSTGGTGDYVFGQSLETLSTGSTGIIAALVLPTLNVSSST